MSAATTGYAATEQRLDSQEHDTPASPRPGPLSGLAQIVARLQASARALLNGHGAQAEAGRQAITAFTIRIASAAIAYLAQVLLARWMGSFEYGVFVFVWVWVLILGGLSPLGLNVAMIRFGPEYAEKGALSLLRGILLASRLMTVAAATLVALAGGLALWLFPDLLERHYLLPAFLALTCLPIFALTDVQDCIARGYGWIRLALLPPFILRPLLILLAMVAAHALGLEMRATTAAGAAIFATWATGLLQTVLLERRLAREVPRGPRRYRTGFWLKVSLPILLIEGFDLLLQNTDVLVISLYRSASDVGIYFAALKTMSLIMFVRFAVGTALAGRFSSLNARGDRAALEQAVRDSVAWTFWPSLAGALVILALGKPLLALFGEAFTAGYSAMVILALGFVARAAMGPVDFLLNMLGEERRSAMVLFLAAALNLALNFALIPAFGLNGAAMATALSLTSAGALFALIARRRLGLHVFVLPARRR